MPANGKDAAAQHSPVQVVETGARPCAAHFLLPVGVIPQTKDGAGGSSCLPSVPPRAMGGDNRKEGALLNIKLCAGGRIITIACILSLL